MPQVGGGGGGGGGGGALPRPEYYDMPYLSHPSHIRVVVHVFFSNSIHEGLDSKKKDDHTHTHTRRNGAS